MSRYQRTKERYWGKPVPPGLKHGPVSNVRKIYGCPCEVCHPPRPEGEKQTWRNGPREDRPLTHGERQKRLRLAKQGMPVPPSLKHGISVYTVYQCRCNICRAAKTAQRDRARNRWRQTARGYWTTRGDMDMICWPPKNAGPDWVCPDSSHEGVA